MLDKIRYKATEHKRNIERKVNKKSKKNSDGSEMLHNIIDMAKPLLSNYLNNNSSLQNIMNMFQLPKDTVDVKKKIDLSKI